MKIKLMLYFLFVPSRNRRASPSDIGSLKQVVKSHVKNHLLDFALNLEKQISSVLKGPFLYLDFYLK